MLIAGATGGVGNQAVQLAAKAGDVAIVGSPGQLPARGDPRPQLIEKILDAHQVLGLDRFFGQIDRGGLPRTLVEDSVNRYATEIGPAVRAAITTSA